MNPRKSSTETLFTIFKLNKEFGEKCTVDPCGKSCKEVLQEIEKHSKDKTPPLSIEDELNLHLLSNQSLNSGKCYATMELLQTFGFKLNENNPIAIKCNELDKETKEKTEAFIKQFNN